MTRQTAPAWQDAKAGARIEIMYTPSLCVFALGVVIVAIGIVSLLWQNPGAAILIGLIVMAMSLFAKDE